MDIGEAVRHLRGGDKVTRRGWNGRGQFLYLVPKANILGAQEQLPFIAIQTVSGSVVPWVASQTDLLADDWVGVQ